MVAMIELDDNDDDNDDDDVVSACNDAMYQYVIHVKKSENQDK